MSIHKISFTVEDDGSPATLRVSFCLPVQTVQVMHTRSQRQMLDEFVAYVRKMHINTKGSQDTLRFIVSLLGGLIIEMDKLQEEKAVKAGGFCGHDPKNDVRPDPEENYGEVALDADTAEVVLEDNTKIDLNKLG